MPCRTVVWDEAPTHPGHNWPGSPRCDARLQLARLAMAHDVCVKLLTRTPTLLRRTIV
jgi:hypothetical protein